ncbi:MAG: flagellar hook-associated protein FlgK, partial [Immundisolibacteraceae bacterium]|nr:flagellar hook-associated protein FlgK [Immundisolibacteraceae bacterium]
MATGLLGIGASALLANQQALATVSHNLANATVEGYSRQTVTMQARPSQLLGSNFFGTGVDVGTVRRNVDQFINQQIYSESGLQSHLQVEQKYLERVDNLLAGGTTGLSSSMDDFFAALQDLSLDPASLPQREVALQTADTLRQRFQSIGQTISDLDREINQEITDQIGKVNALSTSLADLNQALGISNARGGGQAASDLLDQRDRLIGQLSNFVPVTTADQGDGTINVFIGNGQALVVGSKSFDLATTQNSLDASRLEITYQGVGNVQISREITSGSLGGLINARSLVVDPALNQLGRLAVGVSQTANAQHQLGMDLDGLLGGNLFTVGSAEVNADPANAGITGIGVTITDISALTGSDYRLDVDGSSDYILTNLTDNSTQNLGAVPAG